MVFLESNGQAVDTTLTPNCHSVATASFDLNDSTTIVFYTGSVPIWVALVSIGIPKVILIESVTVGSVTLVGTAASPFAIAFNALERDLYTLTLTGNIVDAGTNYVIAGANLGAFSSGAAMKSAIRSLRSPQIL